MALVTGRVNSYREALVRIRFAEGSSFECLVDTGFDGGLMLPQAIALQMQIPILGELTFQMVGGATMSAEVGLASINWLGELRQVEVVVSAGDDALLGTELLTATTLTIDYSRNSVEILNREDSNAKT